MAPNVVTIRRLAAELYGQGMESAGAETRFWAALPALPPAEVAAIVRQLPMKERFWIVHAAVQKTSPERVAAFRAIFSDAELTEMAQQSLPE